MAGSSDQSEWFRTRLVGHRTWAIDDNGQDTMYLVVGSERCLLVDTGWGVGDLPGLVASLTSLPVVVMNTHGHPDHACGNGQFSEVHVAEADEPLVRQFLSVETRRRIWENDILRGPFPRGFSFDTWTTSAAASLVPIRDGHIFDLGDRKLRAISVPGHTPGSLCLLDWEARFLLTGDSILAGPIWLHLDESTPLREFLTSLRRLQSFGGEFDHMLPAHGELPLSRQTLSDLIAGVERILDGKIVGTEEKTFAGDGLRCDFGSCGLVYRPDRL